MDPKWKPDRNSEEAEMLQQIGSLLRQVCGLDVRTDIARGALETASPVTAGVLAVAGKQREDVLELTCWLIDILQHTPLPADALFRELQALGDGGVPLRFRVRSHPENRDRLLLGFVLHIDFQHPSLSRMARLRDVFTRLESFANTLQRLLPVPMGEDRAALLRSYEQFREHLQPVFPIDDDAPAIPDTHAGMVQRMLQHLHAGLPCFLVSPAPLRARILLSCLSRASRDRGGPTLATVRDLFLPPHNLLQLAQRAPGAVVLSLSTLLPGPELRPLLLPALQALSSAGRPVIILLTPQQRNQLAVATDIQEEIRSLVIEPPCFPAVFMQHFTARQAADEDGRCSAEDLTELGRRMQRALKDCTPEEIEQLALPVARREVAMLKHPGEGSMSPAAFILSLEDTVQQTEKR